MLAKNKNIILLSILIFLIIASSLVPLSLAPRGPLHISLQILKGGLILLSWGAFYCLIKASFLEKYKHVYKKDIPGIVVTAIRFLIVVGAFLSVIVFVLDKSIFSILALGGLVSAGLTFALGELILDAFSGVILETESPFHVNDWIKTLDGQEGKVIRVNWRTVILEALDGYLIIVPHRKIAEGFTNYSQPQKSYWDSVNVVLDCAVPVERAVRILQAGAMSAAGVRPRKCAATAVSVGANGIAYEVLYMVPDFTVSREVKHDVINCIMQHLHNYNLNVSQVIGEYVISKEKKTLLEESPLTVENLIKKVDFFKNLPPSVISRLSGNALRKVYAEGEKIVSEGEEGQSIFLIGEGMVEISIAYKNNAGVKKEKKLFCLGYPDSFGEMALLLNEKRSATVTAVMNTVVYEISQELLKLTLQDHPDVFETLTKQAIEKREKNKIAKSQMERLKEKKAIPSKGMLANLKKFFK